jgi:hypothetical protein
MDRNHVIVDGTNRGASARSAAISDQDLLTGRNGIEIYKVSGVTVENLTVCNFLSDASGNAGNQIWWNGGGGSGHIGLGSYAGNHLTASSTYQHPSQWRESWAVLTTGRATPAFSSKYRV